MRCSLLAHLYVEKDKTMTRSIVSALTAALALSFVNSGTASAQWQGGQLPAETIYERTPFWGTLMAVPAFITAFLLLVFIAAGYVYYRDHKRRINAELCDAAGLTLFICGEGIEKLAINPLRSVARNLRRLTQWTRKNGMDYFILYFWGLPMILFEAARDYLTENVKISRKRPAIHH